MTSWGTLPDVRVTSRGLPDAAQPAAPCPEGPFAVGSVLWRDGRGRLMCSVVAKATYELAPGLTAPLDAPLPLQEEEGHWDDDAAKSVHVPSDLAPFKSAAEIVVVGSAFAAPGRAAPVTARLLVGGVDKSIEAFPPRRFRRDGVIEEAQSIGRVMRISLRYEHAAGGPDNPVGLDVVTPDARGSRAIPQLLPPAFALGAPGEHVPTVGFGPLGAGWLPRAGGLGAHDHAWLRRPAVTPVPQTLAARYFQAAPMDQWLDRPLAANERLVLEGLHVEHPRLVMSLSGLEPRAIVAGAGREPLRLAGDLLFIDTDRALCTLTFRGHVQLDERAAGLRVIVVAVPMGAELSADAIRRLEAASDDDAAWAAGEQARPPEPADSVTTTSAAPPAWLVRRPTLPFAGPPPRGAPPPPPSRPAGGLPFESLRAHAPVPPVSDDLDVATLTLVPTLTRPTRAHPFEAPPHDASDDEPPTPRRAPEPPPQSAPQLASLLTLASPPPLPPPAWVVAPAQPEPAPEPPPPETALPRPETAPEPAVSLAPEAAAPEPSPASAPPEPGLPLAAYPLPRCAGIAARLERRPAEDAAILEAAELTPPAWAELHGHWLEAIRAEMARGKKGLLSDYDAAYVAALEAERGPITAAEYARLMIATERGSAADTLTALDLPEGATMRLRRVWLAKTVKDPRAAVELRAAMRAAGSS